MTHLHNPKPLEPLPADPGYSTGGCVIFWNMTTAQSLVYSAPTTGINFGTALAAADIDADGRQVSEGRALSRDIRKRY